MDEAIAVAEKIASMSQPAVMAKEAREPRLRDHARRRSHAERNLFHGTFALEDRSEGMAAFIDKRKPVNKNR